MARSQTAQTESASLLHQLLPPPDHPRSLHRALATASLVLFGFVVLYSAVLAPAVHSDAVQTAQGEGWVGFKEVGWGVSDVRTAQKGAVDKPQGAKGAVADDEVEESQVEEADYAQEGESGSFQTEQSEMVESLLDEGQLAGYRWHDKLQGWDDSSSGRLIVVGDLHGQVNSLTALLSRLSYDNSTDVLVSVGDLVAKAPLEGSLDVVRTLRQVGAQAVRGNHDQGVLQWRAWMEAYGKLNLPQASTADVKEEGLEKRGWFGWGSSSDEEDKDELGEPGSAEQEEEIELPLDSVEDGQSAQDDEGDLLDYDGLLESVPSSTAFVATPRPTRRPAPLPFGITSPGQRPAYTPTTAVPSASVTPLARSEDGALVGKGWEWLSLSKKELNAIGIEVPKKWEWGGEWFDIARKLPSADAEWMKARPLTLRIDELQAYVVHAGMLPWLEYVESRKRAADEYEDGDEGSTDPSSTDTFSSESFTSFTPDDSTTTLLAADATLSLLLEAPNADPFNLLNMRGLKGSRAKGWQVTKKPKGTKWYAVWNEAMASREPDEQVSVFYGHWAGDGLQVNKNSIGLDSGCFYGRRLSALVLPMKKSTMVSSPLSRAPKPLSAKEQLEPTSTKTTSLEPTSTKEALRKKPSKSTTKKPKKKPAHVTARGLSSHSGTTSLRMRKMVRRAKWDAAPPAEDESLAEAEEAAEDSAEGAELALEDEAMEESADEEASEDALGDAPWEEEEDSPFEEGVVRLGGKGAGRKAWVVSMACTVQE